MTTWVKLPFGSHAAALGDEDWGERLGNELCTPGRPMGRRVKNKGRSRITDRDRSVVVGLLVSEQNKDD